MLGGASTFEEALHMLLDMPHASGSCFTIGGPDGRVATVEASGSPPPLILFPPKQGSFTAHTNHPLENDGAIFDFRFSIGFD